MINKKIKAKKSTRKQAKKAPKVKKLYRKDKPADYLIVGGSGGKTLSQFRQDKILLMKKNLLIALETSLGIITTACNACKMPRDYYYAWMRTDADFKRAVDEISEVQIDYVEGHLFEQIKKHVPASTIFYLKCKAKRRGYGGDFMVEQEEPINLDDYTDFEIERIVKLYESKQKSS